MFKYFNAKDNRIVSKKLEIILEFKLIYSTRILIAEKIKTKAELEKKHLECKIEGLKEKMEFFNEMFDTKIYDLKDGVYTGVGKISRVDCSDPLETLKNNKLCVLF